MGTRFELVLEGLDPVHARAAGEAALEVILDCDSRWSRFRTDSLISRINREAGMRAVRVDPLTFELLARCAQLERNSDGAFNVCVGVPMDRVRAKGAVSGPGPSGAFELDAQESTVRFTRAGTAIDLGSIGKGLALDLAAASLTQAGVECALLHGGTSSVIALGAPADMRGGWRVALAAEFGGARANLEHRSLSVSAVRGARCAEVGPARDAHVLDPRSGTLLQSDARAAVVCRSAADCDAWSTALLVLAARESRLEFAARLRGLATPSEFACMVSDPGAGVFEHARGFGNAVFLPSTSNLALAQ